MYVNRKIRPVETSPAIEGREGKRRMMEGVNSSVVF
jgi:hypothetical protein